MVPINNDTNPRVKREKSHSLTAPAARSPQVWSGLSFLNFYVNSTPYDQITREKAGKANQQTNHSITAILLSSSSARRRCCCKNEHHTDYHSERQAS